MKCLDLRHLYIQEYSSYSYYGPENIVILGNITTIPEDAFYNCRRLKSITIPKSVKVISQNAFYGTSPKDVYYTGSKTEWENISIVSGNESLLSATIHFGNELSAEAKAKIEAEARAKAQAEVAAKAAAEA